LLGCGLALIAVSGYSMSRPSELAAIALGLLLVAWGHAGEGVLAAEPTVMPIDPEAWRSSAQRLADRLGGDSVVVEDALDPARLIPGVSGRAGRLRVVARIVRHRGLDAVEVVVGEPPTSGAPDIMVDEKPGASTELPFGARYRVHLGAGATPLPPAATDA